MSLTPDQVYRRRYALGLTQQQLAHRLGVSVSTIANWESGLYQSSEYLALALDTIARMLKVEREAEERRARREKALAGDARDDA